MCGFGSVRADVARSSVPLPSISFHGFRETASILSYALCTPGHYYLDRRSLCVAVIMIQILDDFSIRPSCVMSMNQSCWEMMRDLFFLCFRRFDLCVCVIFGREIIWCKFGACSIEIRSNWTKIVWFFFVFLLLFEYFWFVLIKNG